MMLKILLLAIIQGMAELLPVSSSAHVIVAEKLIGLDPASPEMTMLLVMLHTGTMFSVLIYFWRSWKENYFRSCKAFLFFSKRVFAATAITGIVGLTLKFVIEKVFLGHVPHAEIEMIFGNMNLMASALLAVGLLILYAGIRSERSDALSELDLTKSFLVGAVQGICLPFRGFSRSGATISAGLILGVSKARLEEFSFALAVVLTPPVIVREVMRLLKATAHSPSQALSIADIAALFGPALAGMVMSFVAGLLALKWLSNWLENGRWKVFGYYCMGISMMIFILHGTGHL